MTKRQDCWGYWIGYFRAAAIFLLSVQVQGATALSWSDHKDFRLAPVSPASEGQPGLTAMDPRSTGVWFTNQLTGDLALTNAVAHNGAGVAIGDVDGDDRPDLYFCNLDGPNRFYRNLGNWHFAEVDLGDAACPGQLSTGSAFADVDGDGDLDLLVNGIAVGTRLFLNHGGGRFVERNDSGLSRTASATSMALADIDGDGDLDLYCAHYIDVMHLADPTTRFALARRNDRWVMTRINGEPATAPRWKDRFEVLPDGSVRELPEVHGLYRNDGSGHFTAIQFEPGIYLNTEGKPVGPYRDWGLSVMFRDVNGDGAPDFYVCNDNASPDRFWINTGQGTFREIEPFALRHTSRSSMSLDFADLDRDGVDDFIVLDMIAREHGRRMMQLMRDYPDPQRSERIEEQPRFNRNTLFFGNADGSYVEAALRAGVVATDWSWCPAFIDVDLDGYEDLLVCNGFTFDVMDQDSHDRMRTNRMTFEQQKRFRQHHPSWFTENIAFRNQHDGTFAPVSVAWGFNKRGVSCGMALADLDNDGDLDVVLNNLNDTASLYRNNASAGRIGIRLKGNSPNTQGIGARVRLLGGVVTQSQEMICGGRYLSCDQAMRVFAANSDESKDLRLEVQWRNGSRSMLSVQPNRIYEVIQSSAHPDAAIPPPSKPQPAFFEDISAWFPYVHVEDPFDDWARQALLPRRLSRLGPGLAWYDINGDGWEDLVIAAAREGNLTVGLNEQGRGFKMVKAKSACASDMGAVVGWSDGLGHRRILAGVSNLEDASDRESTIAISELTNSSGSIQIQTASVLPFGTASPGPLALADIDGDGDLDLLAGGRFRPGRYPEPVASKIWLNNNGVLQPSAPWSAPFESLGLVSGATFCDLDGDGDPDLALAIEWGPLRIFRNDQGRFTPWPLGLDRFGGWWTSVTAGDFDGDGRLDLAAGNWGRNSLYELCQPGPVRLFYGDWNEDGNIEIIEAWLGSGQWLPARNRPWLTRAFPDLTQRIPAHEAYGRSTVRDILLHHFDSAKTVEVTCLESAVFLNRGSNFAIIPLPREAQLSPAFAVNAGDFDGDGIEDLFLSQNFFGSGSDTTRDDGGRGLWLKGRGDGTFGAAETGIKILGEQRGAALADLDQDGRIDLAVAQNNGPMRLYLNRGAKRGLRVVLRGPPGNPEAVGAQLRIRYSEGRMGPCRAVQAGSGYWSQNGAVQVLGMAERPAALWIRWPGGREQTLPIPDPEWTVHGEYKK